MDKDYVRDTVRKITKPEDLLLCIFDQVEVLLETEDENKCAVIRRNIEFMQELYLRLTKNTIYV